MMNENAISNILLDVDFLEQEFQRNGRPHLMTAFSELRTVSVGFFFGFFVARTLMFLSYRCATLS